VLGPKDLPKGLYVMSSMTDKASEKQGKEGEKQGTEGDAKEKTSDPVWKKAHKSGQGGQEAAEQFALLRGDEIVARNVTFRVGDDEFTVDVFTRRNDGRYGEYFGIEAKSGFGRRKGRSDRSRQGGSRGGDCRTDT
jgi:hypothetical protein